MNGQTHCLAILLVSLLLAAGCAASSQSRATSIEAQVRSVLQQQAREWNAGNLGGFVETYAKCDRTRFASGGDISLGWETVFARYRKNYADRAAMGTLTFSDLDVTPLGPASALAFGRWHLKRQHDAPSGLFTLVLRRTAEGWRIVHDHTSVASTK